jgi:hypothetical protein
MTPKGTTVKVGAKKNYRNKQRIVMQQSRFIRTDIYAYRALLIAILLFVVGNHSFAQDVEHGFTLNIGGGLTTITGRMPGD